MRRGPACLDVVLLSAWAAQIGKSALVVVVNMIMVRLFEFTAVSMK